MTSQTIQSPERCRLAMSPRKARSKPGKSPRLPVLLLTVFVFVFVQLLVFVGVIFVAFVAVIVAGLIV